MFITKSLLHVEALFRKNSHVKIVTGKFEQLLQNTFYFIFYDEHTFLLINLFNCFFFYYYSKDEQKLKNVHNSSKPFVIYK